MEASGTAPESRPSTNWDRLAEALQALRRSVGEPSYAEIARRITEQRLAQGESIHAARVARTTVYDCFRAGRARVNLPFVREIAQALGGEDAQVDDWIARCRDSSKALVEAPEETTPPDDPVPPQPPSGKQVLQLLAVCVGVSFLGRVVVDLFDLPLYLDMVGTAIAAIALGPWHGAAVGATTNLLGVASSGPASIPFALVNIAGALVWGYGVRRFGFGRTLPRFLVLNLLVAFACTLVAVPILVLMFGGSTGHGQDSITDTLFAMTHTLFVAVGFSNAVVSVTDKVVSGFVALAAISALPGGMRTGLQLVLATPSLARADSAATNDEAR